MARRVAWHLTLALAGVALACGEQREPAGAAGEPRAADAPAAAAPARAVAVEPLPVAVLRVRDMGEIRIELFERDAPRTVANFVKLAESQFYDGTTFHRVVPGFMIQGGDPNTKDRDPRNDGRGGPGWTIPNEANEVSHLRGVVSMANKGRDTGGSQFFVLVADAPQLDGRHTTFGRVAAGMDVVDRVAAVERDVYGRWGPRDRPLEDVVIESVAIERPRAARGDPR